MSFSLVLFLLLFHTCKGEDFLERYLTEKIHRSLKKNNSAVYFVLGTNSQQGEATEKRRHLQYTLDPCGKKNISISHSQVKCEDKLVLGIVDNNKHLLQKMCERQRRRNSTSYGFDVYWAFEETCECISECSDTTFVELWPTCSCDPHGSPGESEIACDFHTCLWDWLVGAGFFIHQAERLTYAYAHIVDTQYASIVSPYYSQISSSCELKFFYNINGPKGEIRVVLEFLKIDGWRNTPQNVTLSRIHSYQESDSVLDLHLVRIGFVARPARIRIDCLISDGKGQAVCTLDKISWMKCGALDVSTTDCNLHQNPTVCQRDGHFMCLEDVECDGIVDCEDGSDEANCEQSVREGSVCNFENPKGIPCDGWKETSDPPQRFGKLFTIATVLPNMSVVDSEGKAIFPRRMTAPLHKKLPNHVMLFSPFVNVTGGVSSLYSLISPKFPPTRQYSLDPKRPESKCTVRFRYCMVTNFFPELHIVSDEHYDDHLLWAATRQNVKNAMLCTWKKVSVSIPRQLLPFRLKWTYRQGANQGTPFIAIDDFSIHPGCFDPNSPAIVAINHTFSTCEATGSTIPQYDSCLRESHSNGGSEIFVDPKTGIRNITIGVEGIYWIKLCGAAGGSLLQEKGGKGNCIITTRSFIEGQTLSFIVGQKGNSPCDIKPDKMSDEQTLLYEHICSNESHSLPENSKVFGYYMGAGGGGATVLMQGLNVSLVAAGGGGAFPNLPQPSKLVETSDGAGFSFTDIKKIKYLNCEICGKTPPTKFFLDQQCMEKYDFLMFGGYGGGGTSCGTGGGGGGGMTGGKAGRFAPGNPGSNLVIPSSLSRPLKKQLIGVNEGDGSIELYLCTLDCPDRSYCDFTSSENPKMECVCIKKSMHFYNGACVLIAIESERSGYPWLIGLVMVVCIFALLFWLVSKCKIIYNKGKKYIGKGAECTGEGTELLDMHNQEKEILELLNNRNFLKTLNSDKLVNLMPQLDNSNITVIEDIGKGAFGNVSRALLRDSNGRGREVAVKVLNNDWHGNSEEMEQNIRNFLMEAVLIRATNLRDTTNTTIQLIGVSFKEAPFKIVMELMQGGNLQTFLRSSRATETNENPNKLVMKDLIQFAADIAGGCATLEKMQFLHRDLAARNCLLTCLGSERRVKIGDFGLATELYHIGGHYVSKSNKRRPIPLKWMPPEAIIDGKFSTKTDVWSFGVVCWEIFTIGKMPYPGVPSEQVLQLLEHGSRLTRPKSCPDEMYQVMLECWQSDPDDRPPFAILCETLETILQNPDWKQIQIPIVFAPEKVSSPVLESPVFNPSAGTPCTVETTLPTPMGEVSWNGTYDRPNSVPFEENREAPPATVFKYDNPTPHQINNDSYFVSYARHNNGKQQERPTMLPLSGPKCRPMP